MTYAITYLILSVLASYFGGKFISFGMNEETSQCKPVSLTTHQSAPLPGNVNVAVSASLIT